MAVEQGWPRGFAFVSLSAAEAGALIGQHGVREIEPLGGGLRNTNYRLIRSADPEPVVLRLYTADPRLASASSDYSSSFKNTSPVPRVVSAQPSADPPWSLQTFISGERFDTVLSRASNAEIEQLAHSAGAVLAHIHAFKFPRGGFFDADLQIAEYLGPGLAGGACSKAGSLAVR